MGLIATELVINALKHAFPGGARGQVVVGFESAATAWRLSVSDDGIGIRHAPGRCSRQNRPRDEHRRGADPPAWWSGIHIRRISRHDRFGDRPPSGSVIHVGQTLGQQRRPSRWLWRVRLDGMVFELPAHPAARLRTASASPLINRCAIGPSEGFPLQQKRRFPGLTSHRQSSGPACSASRQSRPQPLRRQSRRRHGPCPRAIPKAAWRSEHHLRLRARGEISSAARFAPKRSERKHHVRRSPLRHK